MATFLYRAIDDKGRLIKGSMDAQNPMDMEQRLIDIDYELISFSEKKTQRRVKKLSRRDLLSFVIHMQQLTQAGIAIMDGLKDLRDTSEPGQMQIIIAGLITKIEGGKSLSEAMQDYPEVFDHVFINLIRVGERTGRLDRIMEDLAATLKWIDELAAQAKKIMIYPSVVALVVFLVVCFLMIYLVPQLVPFILEMGHELPTHTKVLIWVSEAFSEYWYIIFGAPIVAFVLGRIAYAQHSGFHYWIDALSLKLWIVGPMLLKLKLARFSNYLSLMYSAGIPLLDAIEISRGLVSNKVLEQAIEQSKNELTEGISLTESFRRRKIFPPLVLRMLNVGETSGALDEALNNVTYFYNREVKESIDKIEPAIQPLLTVLMGTIVAWVMLSVLGPVYDTISQTNF